MKWTVRIAGGLGLLLAAVVAILVIMGYRTNAGHGHASVEIGASPEHLWPYLSDDEKFGQWVGWVVAVRGEKPAPDATRVIVMKDENNGGQLMEIKAKYMEFAPPTRLAVHLSVEGMFDGEQSYRLAALGDGRTRMEVDTRFQYVPWFARLMEPLITPAAGKKMAGDLAHLKSLAESNTARVAGQN